MRWPRQSSEILFSTPDGRMMAVPVQTQPSLTVGRPVTLFSTDPRAGIVMFEPTPDGLRFLAALPRVIASSQPITIVMNWGPAVTR